MFGTEKLVPVAEAAVANIMHYSTMGNAKHSSQVALPIN